MKMKWKNVLLILFLLLILSNFTAVSLESDANYFSTELKEGKVLSWERYVHDFSPGGENTLEIIEIEIVQDIPDTPINYDLLYQYFNYSSNGETLNELINLKYILPEFIYAVVYVDGSSTLSLYEYLDEFFLDYIGEPSNYTIEQNQDYIEVNGSKIVTGFYSVLELRIHEETGIVKHAYAHNIFDDGDQDYTINVTFIGGMNLANSEFTMVPIVLIGIPIIGVIVRRKRKTNQPPLG
ncbi:MAG: hypothetical protein ACTSQC_10390 [Candidatus Heimdallarchaeaceae archaeon]